MGKSVDPNGHNGTNTTPAWLMVDSSNSATQRRPQLPAELQLALNLIPAFAWYCNASGGLTFLNERGSNYLGLPKDHPIRHGIETGAEWDSHIALLHPDDHEEARRVWSTCLCTGCAGQVSFRVRNAEGGYRWHLSRAEPVRASDGTLLYWIGVNLDIEDRKQAELYLAEGQRLAHTGSWTFNAAGFDYWSPELFRIYGLDPSGTAPTVEEYMSLVHPDDREFVAKTIQKMFAEHRGFDFTKRIVRPDGEIRRIRCVGSPATHAGAVQEFVGTGIDVTEHELLTQELGRREAYLAEAQRLSHTGSFGWKPDTGEVIWSTETYRIFEYDRALTPTLDLLVERVHPEDRADFQSVIEHGVGGAPDFEHAYRLLMPDGRAKHVHALAHATQDESGNREFVGAVTDMTEQRRAEESLRESESYLAEAQKLSHTGSWAWNPNPNQDIRYWSEECYRVLGFDPAGPVPRFEEFFQNIHPDDQAASRERFEEAIRDKADFELDYRIVHPDKGVRDIHVVGSAVLDRSGDLHEFVGTVIDITERKIAEEKIRGQEAELRQILDLAPQHIGVLGPDGSRLYVNHTALEYLGITLEQWRDAKAHFEFLHPEDREHFLAERSKRILEGKPHELEARLLRHDGEFRWFLFRMTPLKDEQGHITRWYGTATDIQDRKRAEEEIRKENIALREEIIKTSMFEEIVGNSPALQQVLVRVAKVAPTDSTVLITGETGTGKELIARAIHKASKRSNRAFVSVNCAAIPPSLIPSELFGHEKGAFTGATQRRLGRFELAEGGTIFLDEVGELPPETQVALLRVLQEREFERVGGNKSIRANVRVIVATNRDLPAAIAAGTFREDLFYRLNVFPIEIPPLRERREDIPILVQYFIDRYAREAGKNIQNISKETPDLFQAYPWPGNIRELRNVIERSVIVCETETFSVDESWLSRQPLCASPTSQRELRQRVAAEEKQAIEAALMESRGQVFGPSGAAAKLGIARSTLESKIKTLKIDKNRFKLSNPSQEN